MHVTPFSAATILVFATASPLHAQSIEVFGGSARRSHLILTTLAAATWLALLHVSTARPSAQSTRSDAALSDRLIVVFKSDSLVPGATELIEASGGRVVTELGDIGVVIAEAGAGDGTQLRQRLLRDPAILDVVYDFVVSTQNHWAHPLPTFAPALPPDFFYTSSPQQWAVKRIGAAGGGVPTTPDGPTSGAWDLTFGRGVKIAIVDSGINPIHPDLAGKIVFERALAHPTPFQPCIPGAETLASYSNRGARLNALAGPGGAFPLGRCGFSGVPCPETGFVLGACATGIPGTAAPTAETYPELGPPPAGTSFGWGSFPHPPLSPAVLPGFDQHMWYMPGIGTSAATPLVAGAAALVKALRPDLGPQRIRRILQDTAQDLGRPGYDPRPR